MEDLSDHLLRVLKKYWGFNKFRPHQMEICSQIMKGRDACVIMATGSGKSLLYQMPAIAFHEKGIKACVIVVSPLLSLIEDQVSFMREIGIEAEMLVGSTSNRIEEKAIHGQYTVLYITPEKVINWRHGLEELNRNTKIVCLAIDESHCLSEWGHDFRPVYRQLGQLRQWLPHVPMVALTATATDTVVTDIICNLTLINPYIKKTTFNRPNLHYSVKKRINGINSLIDVLSQYGDCTNSRNVPTTTAFPSTLVYVNTKNEAEDVCKSIQCSSRLSGIRCEYYHAGMSASSRTSVHRAFSHDEVQIVVATIAFGMGIHKPDIRLVVNYGMPSSLEAYYQQSGRAGRDGYPAQCVLLYKDTDAAKVFGIATMSHTGSGTVSQDRIAQQIQVMKSYCGESVSCRRRFILAYFKDTETLQCLDSLPSSPSTSCCDICDSVKLSHSLATRHSTSETGTGTGWMTTGSNSHGAAAASSSHNHHAANGRVDLSAEIKLILRAVADCGEYFGLTTPVALLMGSSSKQVQRVRGHDQSPVYGAGKTHPTEWWLELGRLLCEPSCPCGQLLEAKLTKGKATGGFGYQRILLTRAGQGVLHAPPSGQSSPLVVQLTPALMRSLRPPAVTVPAVAVAVAGPQSQSRPQPRQLPSSTNLAGAPRLPTSTSTSAVAVPVPVQRSLSSEKDYQRPTHQESTAPTPAPATPALTTTQSLQLETKLRRLRSLIAQRSGAPPYSILSSEDLKALLHELPVSLSQLQGLSGWGDWKRRAYGPEFTSEIRTFLEECQIPLPPAVVITGVLVDTDINSNNSNDINSTAATGTPCDVVELAEDTEAEVDNNGNDSIGDSTHHHTTTATTADTIITTTSMEITANKISPNRLLYIPQYNINGNNNFSNNNDNGSGGSTSAPPATATASHVLSNKEEVTAPLPVPLDGRSNLPNREEDCHAASTLISYSGHTTASATASATVTGVSDGCYFSLRPSFSSVSSNYYNNNYNYPYDSTDVVQSPMTSHVLLQPAPAPLPPSLSPPPPLPVTLHRETSHHPDPDPDPDPCMKGASDRYTDTDRDVATKQTPPSMIQVVESPGGDKDRGTAATATRMSLPLPALKKARTIPVFGLRGGNHMKKASGIKLKSPKVVGGESVTSSSSTSASPPFPAGSSSSSTATSSSTPAGAAFPSDHLPELVLQLLRDSCTGGDGDGGGMSFMDIVTALIRINMSLQRQQDTVLQYDNGDRVRFSSAVRSVLTQLSEECCIYLDRDKYRCI